MESSISTGPSETGKSLQNILNKGNYPTEAVGCKQYQPDRSLSERTKRLRAIQESAALHQERRRLNVAHLFTRHGSQAKQIANHDGRPPRNKQAEAAYRVQNDDRLKIYAKLGKRRRDIESPTTISARDYKKGKDPG